MGVSIIGLAMMLASAGQTSPNEGASEATREEVTRELAAPAPRTKPVVVPPHALDPATPLADQAPPATSAEPPAPPVSPEGGDIIIVNASARHIRADPLSGINAASFEAVTAIDKAVVAPVAGNYEKIMPKPVRNGLRNVLINLAEPIVFVNYLLQFKPGKAVETVGRFAINSSIGLVGLFDIAKRKPFNLPYRQNGFANTFAYHGVVNGPYLFLPILGPTTIRDLVGRMLDVSVVPTLVGKPFNKPLYSLSTGIVKSLNDRVEFDEQIDANRAKADPYVATRDFYLKRRQAEINALHSAAYRARKGIPDPVLSPVSTR